MNIFFSAKNVLNYHLTDWERVTYICFSKLGHHCMRYNGLSLVWCQTIILTNVWLSSIGPLRRYFTEIVIEIQTFSFNKMPLRIWSAKWRSFCVKSKHDWDGNLSSPVMKYGSPEGTFLVEIKFTLRGEYSLRKKILFTMSLKAFHTF